MGEQNLQETQVQLAKSQVEDFSRAPVPVSSLAEGLATAQQLREKGDTAAELDLLQKLTAAYPDANEAWARGADLLVRDRRLEAADAWTCDGLAQCPADFRLLHQHARIAEARSDWAAAAERWSRFGNHHPTEWEGYVNRSVCLRILGRLDEAEATILDGQAQLPNARELRIEHARIAEGRRDWEAALQHWTAARELFPDYWTCYAGIGGSLRELGRFEEADAILREGIERNPDEPDLLMGYAQVADARGDAEASLPRWLSARGRFPDRWLFHSAAANCLRQLGRFEEAAECLSAGQKRLPTERALFIDRARLAEAQRDWNEAQRRWAEVVERFPDAWIGYLGAGNALRLLRRYDEADAVLAAGQARCPSETELFVGYAQNAEARADWDTALQRWKAVQARAPEHRDALVRAAGCLLELRRWDEADAFLAEAQKRLPNDFALAVASARLATGHFDRKEAARRWEAVRDRFPDQAEGWIGSATALAEAGDDEAAISCFDQALERLPGSFELGVAAAALYTRLRSPDRALDAWERIRQDFPEQPIGYIRGADALQDVGRGGDADALLKEALQRFPNDSEIRRAEAIIALRRGDLAEAARRLQAAVERDPDDLPLAQHWVETVLRLRRPGEARAAIGIVLERFPDAPAIVQQAVRAMWLAGEQDDALALWHSAIANPDFPHQETFRLAYEMIGEDVPTHHTRKLLRHLLTEPDSGERYWRPLLAALLRPDRITRDQVEILADLVRTSPPEALTPAVRDVVRTALRLDVTDQDIWRFFDTYLARERLGIAGALFTDIDRPSEYHSRVRTLFEQYIAARLRRPDWIGEDSAGEVVALLQFAAVASHSAYRDLVEASRSRLDVGGLAARNELQTAPGILGSILASAAPKSAPGLLKANRKLRIALCISGQLRGFREAYNSWQALRLDRHDISVFVDCWSAVGLNWERIWAFTRGDLSLHSALYSGGIGFVRSRYPRLADALDDAMAAGGTVTVPQLQQFYRTPHVRLEDDADPAFAGRSNQWKMHYKMSRALSLARESGEDFDLMVRARPDREILQASDFDLHEIYASSAAENVLFMLDHPAVLRDGGHYWLGDQFAFGTSSVISSFCNILPEIRRFADAGRLPRDVDPALPMHFTPFLMTFYRGILVRPIPGVEFGDFINPPLLSVPEIHDLLILDLQTRAADEFDRALLRACEQALNNGSGRAVA